MDQGKSDASLGFIELEETLGNLAKALYQTHTHTLDQEGCEALRRW